MVEVCEERYRIGRPAAATPTPTPTPTPGGPTQQPAPPADADGDGVTVPADCWDQNATVHPGAKEVPGNGFDDDCAGGDAPAKIVATIRGKWKAKNGRVWLNTLSVLEAPEGALVEVTCDGKRCPFKRRTAAVNAKGSAFLEVLQAQAAAEDHDRRARHVPEQDRPRRPLQHQDRRRPEHAAPCVPPGETEGEALLSVERVGGRVAVGDAVSAPARPARPPRRRRGAGRRRRRSAA